VDNSGVQSGKLWDIFCKVIDNFGDIGVCWRLAAGLAASGERVRLWVDDASALTWMAPGGSPGVEVRPWTQPIQTQDLTPGDILLETFGCQIAPEFIAAYAEWTSARDIRSMWINLEYLSAEDFVTRSHGLPSPVMTGPGTGLNKYFYYPGFGANTGGLLREPDLAERQCRFDRADWLKQRGIEWRGKRLVSLFCYEPVALGELLSQLASDTAQTRLLVTSGRATGAVKACIEDNTRLQPLWNRRGALSITYLPALTQDDFDRLLWACDLNFVRGEDSLVRALWAGKAFIWQVYPQHDDAHHSKLDALLEVLHAPPSLRAFHYLWNGLQLQPAEKGQNQRQLPALALAQWQETVADARSEQYRHDDLVTQLVRFASKYR
jgi:uncharacterized repeat protein (TIGR03837 family)